MGIAIVALMGIAYYVSTTDGLAQLITFGSHGEISGAATAAARSSRSAWSPSASSAWVR
jgi:hypothetical protein